MYIVTKPLEKKPSNKQSLSLHIYLLVCLLVLAAYWLVKMKDYTALLYIDSEIKRLEQEKTQLEQSVQQLSTTIAVVTYANQNYGFDYIEETIYRNMGLGYGNERIIHLDPNFTFQPKPKA